MTAYTTRTKLLSADGDTPVRVTFFVADQGGYVYYQTDRMRERQQVCDDLRLVGDCMMSSGPTLKADVRAAMRRGRERERRRQASDLWRARC